VDDAFSSVKPSEKTSVILQLNECDSKENLKDYFSAFGDVKYIGTIVAFVILENVPQEKLPELAKDPRVAAVEMPREVKLFHDTSTRSIRQRTSNTYSPDTYADDFPGVDGTGVNIAIVDTGVDDAVHAGFAGKFVSGYNACTNTVGNPDDDLPSPSIDAGSDGVCDTAAAGDDDQFAAVGQTFANLACAGPGPNGVLNSVPAGDDFIGQINYTDASGLFVLCTSTQVVATGADGICNTNAAVDDYQVAPFNSPPPNSPCVGPGLNGVIDSTPSGDDVLGLVHHGTHVAGSALGLGAGPGCRNADDGSGLNNCAGVAVGAGLVDVKVFQNGCVTDEALLVQALDWIWSDGNADVVNMSLGTDDQADGTDTISKVINGLVANDITVVVASGNSVGNCLGAVQASTLAITVANDNDIGSVNRNDDAFAFSSTFGPRVDFTPVNTDVGMLKPDIAAPGTGIVSVLGETGNTPDGYHALSGTSMASPHVAGAAALLLDQRPDVPPGAIKDLFKRTAFQTPQQVAAGASFPAVDPVYNVNWGWGLLDLFAAGTQLETGITDMSFTDCTGPHPDYPSNRRCLLSGGKPSYANNVDIQLATDPPVQEVANTITVTVENRATAAAQDVTVCVGVKDFAVGVQEFYDVGCRSIALLAPSAGGSVSIPWTPTASNHQCIQASIDYGFDTDFTNNLTQRNVNPVPGASTSKARFRVENPLNEPGEIILQLVESPEANKVLEATRVSGVPIGQRFPIMPEDCPLLGEIEFFPNSNPPVGAGGLVYVTGRIFTPNNERGIELSGVAFDYKIVDPGLQAAYSCGRHRDAGVILIPLELDEKRRPTSDPRRIVDLVKVVFNVPMQPPEKVSLVDAIQIDAVAGSKVPGFEAFFVDENGDPSGETAGTDLMIQFLESLPNRERYNFDFEAFQDLDRDPLTGDRNFQIIVLQGDANGSGAVTGPDVSFVRGQLNQPVESGRSSRADGNQTGTVTATDISYTRGRIGSSAP
jgi:subtilisin family serine protease